MNSYFNIQSLDFFNKNNPDINTLKQLTDSQVELLFMNPPVDQNGMNHRPSNQEFKKNQDLIFSGCSETQGSYISEKDDPNKMYKNIWGFVISDSLNFDSINLGIGGESSYRIIQRLLSHFKKYGNPKNLFCLFPDPYRFTSPTQNDFLIAQRPYGGDFLQNTHHNYETIGHDMPNYLKKPFAKEDVLPISFPIFFNFQAISYLETYCQEAGINFLWGSWHQDTNTMANIINSKHSYYYKDFIDLTPNDFEVEDILCHKNLYDQYPEIYSTGSDNWHLGTHGHAHIANKFVKAYNERFL
jgi:hypothetical protein